MKKFIPAAECNFQFSRSGGPGGQNVNKVSSRVTVSWDFKSSKILTDQEKGFLESNASVQSALNKAGELVVTEQRTRAQAQNRELALDKLNALVLKALTRPRPRKHTKVSRAQRGKRFDEKKQRARRLRDRRPVD